jgi:hypothetical protein
VFQQAQEPDFGPVILPNRTNGETLKAAAGLGVSVLNSHFGGSPLSFAAWQNQRWDAGWARFSVEFHQRQTRSRLLPYPS